MYLLPKSNKAFTLVELLVAVGIIAVMTGLAIPNYLNKIREQELKNGAQQVLTDIRRTLVKSQTSIEGTGWYVTITAPSTYSVYKCPNTLVYTDTLKPSSLQFVTSTNLYFQKNTGILVTTACGTTQSASVPIEIEHTTVSKCTTINVSGSGIISYDETNTVGACTP